MRFTTNLACTECEAALSIERDYNDTTDVLECTECGWWTRISFGLTTQTAVTAA